MGLNWVEWLNGKMLFVNCVNGNLLSRLPSDSPLIRLIPTKFRSFEAKCIEVPAQWLAC